jgi:transposase
MEERIPMNTKDLKRLKVLTDVSEGRVKQSKAAQIIGISSRQLSRLLSRFRVEGAKGVISRKVGRVGNRRLSQEKREIILGFFKNPDHHDFGPTLAHEYLAESGATTISVTALANFGLFLA